MLHANKGGYKMEDLRYFAKALGIKSSGRKAELISAISSILNQYYGQQYST
jgi:hypothetical protein